MERFSVQNRKKLLYQKQNKQNLSTIILFQSYNHTSVIYLLTIIWHISVAFLQYEVYPGSTLPDLFDGLTVCHSGCAVSINLNELITHLQNQSNNPIIPHLYHFHIY